MCCRLLVPPFSLLVDHLFDVYRESWRRHTILSSNLSTSSATSTSGSPRYRLRFCDLTQYVQQLQKITFIHQKLTEPKCKSNSVPSEPCSRIESQASWSMLCSLCVGRLVSHYHLGWSLRKPPFLEPTTHSALQLSRAAPGTSPRCLEHVVARCSFPPLQVLRVAYIPRPHPPSRWTMNIDCFAFQVSFNSVFNI